MRSYEMTEIGHRGLAECLTEAFTIATDDCDGVFLSVDIDVCDPGHAPGTGTPEPGGLVGAGAARLGPADLPGAPGRRARRGRGQSRRTTTSDITAAPGQPGDPRGAVRPSPAGGVTSGTERPGTRPGPC